jgi:nucleoside-diphosphate-sugar epimerase
MVYVSTSGVYGDCAGALISEVRKINPANARAVRRADAEQVWRHWARRTGSCLSILRVPGIYASDRLPIERLKQGTPALLAEQDVYTNHIHADDLARLIVHTLFHGSANRIYHASDDSHLLMGDYFDAVAERAALPRPPRLARSELMQQVSPVLLSFMSESRRMDNARIKSELGFRFLYPGVLDGLNNALMKN